MNETEIMWHRWCKNADNNPEKEAIIHWIAEEEPVRWTFSSLISSAKEFSFLLREKGIKRGEVCALIIRHNSNFYPIYMAVSNLGAIPAVLAYPNPRLHPDKFRQGVEGMSQRSGLDWILTEKELEPIIKPLVEKKGSTIKGIHFPLTWETDDGKWTMENGSNGDFFKEINDLHKNIKSTDPFLLQHSSGT